jgi:uncharacterized repeat protein (TIGR02543 family)
LLENSRVARLGVFGTAIDSLLLENNFLGGKRMKKALYVLLAALTIIGMVSCGGDSGGGGTTTYNVTFKQNYTSEDATADVVVKVEKGKTIPVESVPEADVRDGYESIGWYSAAEDTGGTELNVATPVTANVTYYARWVSFDPVTQVKVTFDYNYAGSPANGLRIVLKNGTITAANFPAAPTRAGYLFDGWFTIKGATGGTELTATTDVGAENQSVYARWSESINMTYNSNGGVGGKTEAVRKGVDFALPVGDVSRAGWILTGFNSMQTGSGTAYLVGATVSFTANTTLYAQWKRPETIDPADEIVEELTLGNSWFAVYQFTLPSGKTWADYKNGGLVASYKLSQALLDNGMARAIRVMGTFLDTGTYSIDVGTAQAPNIQTGNYKEVTGDVYTFADTQVTGAQGAILAAKGPLIDIYNGVQMAAVGQWQGGNSAPYIISGMGGAWADNNMGTELSKLGVEPTADTWFELSYIIDGSKKNGSHLAARVPADTATGPFYFAVGLPGQNSGNTFQVKNVTIVGTTTGTVDVVGMPLYYKNSNAAAGATPLYRAYNGQFTKDGTNGTDLGGWRIVSGEANLVPIQKDLGAAPTLVTVTWDQNYTGGSANKTLKVISGEKLASSQLSKPERAGYLCNGWFDRPASTAVPPTDPNNSVEITNATVFSADTTIYAQWRTFTPNMTPWEISAPTMLYHGGAAASSLDSEGFIAMMNGTNNAAAGRGEYDSLICFSLVDEDLGLIAGVPTDKIAGFLYVSVEWEAKRTDTTGGTMALGIKNSVDSWNAPPTALRPTDFNAYPDLGSATDLVASGSFKWPLSMFGSPDTGKKMGFGIQCNAGGHSADFKLKIKKITFSAN